MKIKKIRLAILNENTWRNFLFVPIFTKILLIGVLLMIVTSCEDEKIEIPSTPKTEANDTLKLKSTEILELKQIQSDIIKDISFENAISYFGERTQLCAPKELQFIKDSVLILKPNEVIEKYKIKWINDKLFLHNESSDTWEYCGTKINENKFTLNIGFFLTKSINKQRSLEIIGQEYFLLSYSDLIHHLSIENKTDTDNITIWLKTQYTFEY